jgi:hypothetical protein
MEAIRLSMYVAENVYMHMMHTKLDLLCSYLQLSIRVYYSTANASTDS